MRDLVRRTDLSVPPLKTVRGEHVGDQQAVDAVLRKEARLAVISQLPQVNLEVRTLVVELSCDVDMVRNSNVRTVKILMTPEGGYTIKSDREILEDTR